MKTSIALIVALLLGLLIARLAAQEVEAACRVTCSPEQMANVRMDSLDCVIDGSSPVECLERAKLEHCE